MEPRGSWDESGGRPTSAGETAGVEGPQPGPLLYLDGAVVPLDQGRVGVEDRGFQLGDGVYEVLKVSAGRLLWLDDHLERLEWSLGQIRLSGALEGHDLRRVLPSLVETCGAKEGTVYVQVTRGAAPREFTFPEGVTPTVLAYVRSQVFPTPSQILAGISLHAVEDVRWARCDIKSTNLLAAVLAKQEARAVGAEEALYVSPDGVVREGGSSNVFVVLDGVVRTHPADNRILNGITRCHVIEAARALGMVVVEEAVHYRDIARAQEVFVASTTRDIMPVVRVGGLGVDAAPVNAGAPGPATMALVDAIRALIAREVGMPPPPALSGPKTPSRDE